MGALDDWQSWQDVRHWASRKWDTGWKRYWDYLKLATWGIAMAGVILYIVRLSNTIAQNPDDVAEHFDYALPLMLTWAFLPLWAQSTEPKDPEQTELLRQLPGRVGRAVITRTVANSVAVYFAGISVYALIATSRPTALIPVAVTLGGALIASGHKTWARLRKLSTQLHHNIEVLKRDLEMIHDSGDEVNKRKDAALRSWNVVQLDLWTNVDTGYAFYGTPFLPLTMTHWLNGEVKRAIDSLSANGDAAKDVLTVLNKVQEACFGRIDSVA
ncbi:hypothetical protein [Streptomyces sp. NPDC090994]|uniref:hypothetical protein n=1 Tax=Streptomyces sp. NPDC090994 TaxID=3365969 RepID=UPI00380D593D